MKEMIKYYIREHKEEIIETLKELIRIPSVSGQKEELAPFGKECTKVLEHIHSLYTKKRI